MDPVPAKELLGQISWSGQDDKLYVITAYGNFHEILIRAQTVENGNGDICSLNLCNQLSASMTISCAFPPFWTDDGSRNQLTQYIKHVNIYMQKYKSSSKTSKLRAFLNSLLTSPHASWAEQMAEIQKVI